VVMKVVFTAEVRARVLVESLPRPNFCCIVQGDIYVIYGMAATTMIASTYSYLLGTFDSISGTKANPDIIPNHSAWSMSSSKHTSRR
jgi:hypothetical protein